MKGIRALLIVAVFASGLLAAAWWVWHQQGARLASRLAADLESVSEGQIDDLLDQLLRVGEPGVLAVIDAMASPRQELAERAAMALADEVERWKALPPEAATPRLTSLAQALAGRVGRFDPLASQRAATIARRVLATVGEGTPEASQVVLACEEVLRSAAATVDGADRPGHIADRALRVCDTALQADSSVAATARTPDSKAAAAPLPDATAKGAEHGDAGSAGRPGESPPLGSLSKGDARSVDDAEGPLGSGRGGPSIANEPAQLPTVRHHAGGGRGSPGGDGASEGPTREEVFAMIRRLRDRDPAQAAEAEAALRQRGFQDREIALARQLYHPDPQMRRGLARVLPEVPGLDAAAWLMELGRDADAEVRLTAFTLLATTGDPAILDAVKGLIRGDTDPRIQRLAERLDGTLR